MFLFVLHPLPAVSVLSSSRCLDQAWVSLAMQNHSSSLRSPGWKGSASSSLSFEFCLGGKTKSSRRNFHGDHSPTVLLVGKNRKARILTLYDLVPMQIVYLQPWTNMIILIPTKELTNCQTWLLVLYYLTRDLTVPL